MDAFKSDIALRLGLAPELLFGTKLPLREVIAVSPHATNSIDLLEAFAGALASAGLDDAVNLPAFTLDSSIDAVIDEIAAQVAAVSEEGK